VCSKTSDLIIGMDQIPRHLPLLALGELQDITYLDPLAQ
jgi:hypothetical protein